MTVATILPRHSKFSAINGSHITPIALGIKSLVSINITSKTRNPLGISRQLWQLQCHNPIPIFKEKFKFWISCYFTLLSIKFYGHRMLLVFRRYWGIQAYMEHGKWRSNLPKLIIKMLRESLQLEHLMLVTFFFFFPFFFCHSNYLVFLLKII